MFKTCLGLLAAMLADNIEIGGELHIERLYLFCLIWTFGGLLDASDRKAFSDLLKTLSTAYVLLSHFHGGITLCTNVFYQSVI